jgi:hypothetical protein
VFVRPLRQLDVGDGVVPVAVEARGDQDQVRTEPVDLGDDVPVEKLDQLRIPRVGAEREVQGGPLAGSLPPLHPSSGAGEAEGRVLVETAEEREGVLLERSWVPFPW